MGDFNHFYTSAGQTCIAVVSKSKIDEEKLSSGTNDDYPDLSNHVGIGTLRYCHHHKPPFYKVRISQNCFPRSVTQARARIVAISIKFWIYLVSHVSVSSVCW